MWLDNTKDTKGKWIEWRTKGTKKKTLQTRSPKTEGGSESDNDQADVILGYSTNSALRLQSDGYICNEIQIASKKL